MYITTKAKFEWDNVKKEYVEVYTEGYEYEGELALAHQKKETHSHTGSSGTEADAVYTEYNMADYTDNGRYLQGMAQYLEDSSQGHTGGGIGSRDYDPSEEWLMGASGDQLATGFGLDEGEYGMYFQDFDPWQTELAQKERDLVEGGLETKYGESGYETQKISDVYTTQLQGIGRKSIEAGQELSAAFGQATGNMQSSWLDTSSQIAARGAQSGFSGAGRGRKGRQVTQDMQRTFSDTASGSTRAYNTMIGDLSQKKSELDIGKTYDDARISDLYSSGMDTAALDFLKTETKEQKQYVDDVYATLGNLAASGAWDEEVEASDDSCIKGDAPVLMSNGEIKQIKDIVKGDKIIGWGNKIHTVVELRPRKLGNRKFYGFNGGVAFFTEEHPLMTLDGWKSLDPAQTKKENPIMDIDRLQVGDVVMIAKYTEQIGFAYKPTLIKSFVTEEDDPDTDVYNLHLSDGVSFHIYNIPFHTVQSGVVVDKYAEEGLNNLSDEDKQRFATAFSTVPGLLEATGKAFGSTFINIFTKLGEK